MGPDIGASYGLSPTRHTGMGLRCDVPYNIGVPCKIETMRIILWGPSLRDCEVGVRGTARPTAKSQAKSPRP